MRTSVRSGAALHLDRINGGPYLLLEFSFGGLLAAMYAGTYPDDVLGLLMLDSTLPTDEEVDNLIPATSQKQVKAEAEENAERVDFYDTLDQAKGAGGLDPGCAGDICRGGAGGTAE